MRGGTSTGGAGDYYQATVRTGPAREGRGLMALPAGPAGRGRSVPTACANAHMLRVPQSSRAPAEMKCDWQNTTLEVNGQRSMVNGQR